MTTGRINQVAAFSNLDPIDRSPIECRDRSTATLCVRHGIGRPDHDHRSPTREPDCRDRCAFSSSRSDALTIVRSNLKGEMLAGTPLPGPTTLTPDSAELQLREELAPHDADGSFPFQLRNPYPYKLHSLSPRSAKGLSLTRLQGASRSFALSALRSHRLPRLPPIPGVGTSDRPPSVAADQKDDPRIDPSAVAHFHSQRVTPIVPVSLAVPARRANWFRRACTPRPPCPSNRPPRSTALTEASTLPDRKIEKFNLPPPVAIWSRRAHPGHL